MQSETLDALHKIHLESLLEVDRICRKHGIRYFIVGGTLLGAVRHGGFIPWDDDLDIGLLREEYERLLHILPSELSDLYFLQTWKNDPGYYLPFAKLRVNNTRFVEHNSRLAPGHKGIFIDIFPYDNAPDSALMRKMHQSLTKMLRVAVLARSAYDPPKGAVRRGTYRVLRVVAPVLPLRAWMALEQCAMRLCRSNSSRDVVSLGGTYGYRKECLPRGYFATQIDLAFEGSTVRAPQGFREYLEAIYGDYMTPPPPEKRENRHGVEELSFDCRADGYDR